MDNSFLVLVITTWFTLSVISSMLSSLFIVGDPTDLAGLLVSSTSSVSKNILRAVVTFVLVVVCGSLVPDVSEGVDETTEAADAVFASVGDLEVTLENAFDADSVVTAVDSGTGESVSARPDAAPLDSVMTLTSADSSDSVLTVANAVIVVINSLMSLAVVDIVGILV